METAESVEKIECDNDSRACDNGAYRNWLANDAVHWALQGVGDWYVVFA